jgi:ankyrin repeat protein
MEVTPRIVFGAIVAFAAVGFFYLVKNEKKRQYTHIQVLSLEIKTLEPLKNETLVLGLFTKACDVFQKHLHGKKATVRQASTAYSLYKQIKEGDADEFANNKTNTAAEKYNVWLQQAGKSDR